MIIQKLLFPQENVCDEWEMYFHGGTRTNAEVNELSLKAGQELSLETYFNAFSICKWKKYTRLENLTLHLFVRGKVKVRAFHAVGAAYHEGDPRDNTKDVYLYREAEREEIEVMQQQTEDGYLLTFPKLYEEGIVYVTLTAEEDSIFYGGEYTTDINRRNEVNLALCICTFKREEFLKRNVEQIKTQILESPASPLYGHAEVYISDNGQTLPPDYFGSEQIHLYPNKNAGGAGGFTRTMIESILRRPNSPFTHVILMDDDIILDRNVLERTYAFLCLLKEEYAAAMVGGELFELDKRYLQFEAGAAFRGTVIQSYNQRWDMRERDAVAANEIENPMNFNGWWYCCIPVEYVRHNLPIPVFIHRDDVEYGARNEREGTILLNGICVWHPQGPNKAPVAMNYYDVRNDLIAMCDLPDRANKWQVMGHITRGTLGNMLRYRYRVIDCVYHGLEDFYRGPEYFMKLDPVENHKTLARYNYEFQPLPETIKEEDILHEKAEDMKGHVFLRAALCWLLPAKDEMRISGLEDIGCAFRAKRICFVDEIRKEVIITEKSYRQAFRCFGNYLLAMGMIFFRHEAMMKRWAKKKSEYTSREFWEAYLEINQ